jgi:gamma-glutamylcyclotransferase (GGCT)/AIG2-like uncharacterized protein YtfP
VPTDLLFTYGTLMRGFRLHRLLAERAAYLGRGRVTGRIVDLGSYPGAVPAPDLELLGFRKCAEDRVVFEILLGEEASA